MFSNETSRNSVVERYLHRIATIYESISRKRKVMTRDEYDAEVYLLDKNIFTKSRVLIPINIYIIHSALFVIEPIKQQITYCDSLKWNRNYIMRTILLYLKHIYIKYTAEDMSQLLIFTISLEKINEFIIYPTAVIRRMIIKLNQRYPSC